jgi:hypothetical protein
MDGGYGGGWHDPAAKPQRLASFARGLGGKVHFEWTQAYLAARVWIIFIFMSKKLCVE